MRLAEPELVELERCAAWRQALGLVRRDDDGPSRPAKEVGDVAILLGEPGSRVDEEDDDVGLGDRLARLFRHLVQDAVFGDRLEPAGVDGEERAGRRRGRGRSDGRA